MALSREQILQADGHRRECVPVPEWGGDVYVRTMTGRERDRWESDALPEERDGKPNLDNIRARLLVLTLCDETGKRLFAAEDAAALGEQPADVLDRLYDAARKLNRLTTDSEKELEKNSASDPSAALP